MKNKKQIMVIGGMVLVLAMTLMSPVKEAVAQAGGQGDVGTQTGAQTGGGSSGTSVPRVIVSGFDTEPAEVRAGSNFKLIIHLKNTSKKTAVSNMLFDLGASTEGADAAASAPAFLPVSGSSSIYLDKIVASGTKDITIDMNAKADLIQKPYSIAVSMKYEDGDGTQFDGASTVSVPVKQDARFEFSEPEISPATIAVGEEGNITSSIYNLGRTKLHNVKARFEGDGIKGKEIFIGNVEPGATASIDGMVTGETESVAAGAAKMIVTYEDEASVLATVEKELVLPVTAQNMDMPVSTESEPEEKKGLPIIPIAIGAVVVAGLATIIILIKRKKKKAKALEEGDLKDEIDRLVEDEQQ